MLTGSKIQAKALSHSGDFVLGEGTRHELSYLIHYHTLLQNATDIIRKCDSYFITKCDRSLLQNALSYLLQKATVLLRNGTVITKCDGFITKCDSYNKMRCLVQIATRKYAFRRNIFA